MSYALLLCGLLAVDASFKSEEIKSDDMAYDIGKEIRCPVCQGMPIAESPSGMAQDMMKIVRQKIHEGQSAEDIKLYFVQRYGEWVLLKPPLQGMTLWVWILPPVFLLLMLMIGIYRWWLLRRVTSVKNIPSLPANEQALLDPFLKAIRDEVER